MSPQLVDIGVGFAVVGLLSMRGILGDAFTFTIGVASSLIMPQSPAKTKGNWNSEGLLHREGREDYRQPIIRDDPQKGGMHNRQALSVHQIWECTKDHDIWPLYTLGLFGLPKYPIDQYLRLSFRQFGFNPIQTNLLSIPSIVGSSITMLLITVFSELVNNRSFVAMAEDFSLLPSFAALLALPDPISPWTYFAKLRTHSIQVTWTSRNAGSVQNRTISAA
ncbi:hypothetical protein BDV06DRAFT_225959 [Aspergillus oleicola]